MSPVNFTIGLVQNRWKKDVFTGLEKNTVTIGLLSYLLVSNQALGEGFLCGASASDPSVPPQGAEPERLAAQA